MKQYLLDIMNKKQNGLYLCELPTGHGKTYSASQSICNYVNYIKKNNIEDDRKIIYLTTLTKNLPSEELIKAFGSLNEFKKHVLQIKSNVEEVLDKIDTLKVHKDTKPAIFNQLKLEVNDYKNAVEKAYNKKYIESCYKAVEDSERQLRKEIKDILYKQSTRANERKELIKNDDRFKWIGELYPAVFVDDYKVLLMTVKKFMVQNSVIYDSSYSFLTSNIIKNAIIIVDEFDATEETIQDEIINKSINTYADIIETFRSIKTGLHRSFSKEIREAMRIDEETNNKISYSYLVKESDEIEKNYHTNLNFKTVFESIDKNVPALFSDGTFFTISKTGNDYVRLSINEENNRVDIICGDKRNFIEYKDDNKHINIFALLSAINKFMNHFRRFIMKSADKYTKDENKRRMKDNRDAIRIEDATSTVLSPFSLSVNQKEMLMGDIYSRANNKRNQTFLDDSSFYNRGMGYNLFLDDDSHNDSTEIRHITVHDTPEKILLYLSNHATVIGISASAEFKTVTGNYNLEYLEDKLGENFHYTPSCVNERILNELNKKWESYSNGNINVHVEIMENKNSVGDIESFIKKVTNRNNYSIICDSILNESNEFVRNKYFNIFKSMCLFNENNEINSLLYLGMALPRISKDSMDENVLKKLYDISKKGNADSQFVVLKGTNYEKDKEALLQRLSKGEKIFVMSSYKTIGAGQNLQYEIPDGINCCFLGEKNSEDKRYCKKDFDAIYLGDVTNLVVNTYSDESINETGLLKMLFQIKNLYENGEINYQEETQTVKLAFKKYNGSKERKSNILYSRKSVDVHASKVVLQAVGRICRTFAKNKSIHLYIESNLLNRVSIGELNKHILTPEMKKIVECKKNYGKENKYDNDKALNIAEKVSTNSWRMVKSLISSEWTQETMLTWYVLRELVLSTPTASLEESKKEQYIRNLYITCGEEIDSYFYSQISDYRNVAVSFDSSEHKFKSSGRALKDYQNNVHIYKVSEQNSGLSNLMKYPGMKEYFEISGYSTKFEKNLYIMSPILFNNIYKGALGEVGGKFILEKELGIKLKNITNPEYFEVFDFELCEGVYIDFKNWNKTNYQDKNILMDKIVKKMDKINAKRVYIINIFADNEYKATETIDERIIQIPALINEKGQIYQNNINIIKKEDIRHAN